MTESGLGASLRRAGGAVIVNHVEEPFPVDPADPAAGLEALRAFDHDQFLDAVNRVAQTIRKWQKQCKEYREKAKRDILIGMILEDKILDFIETKSKIVEGEPPKPEPQANEAASKTEDASQASAPEGTHFQRP